jgi:hypothetical protein
MSDLKVYNPRFRTTCTCGQTHRAWGTVNVSIGGIDMLAEIGSQGIEWPFSVVVPENIRLDVEREILRAWCDAAQERLLAINGGSK